MLRRTRVGALRPVRDADAEIAVEQRPLGDYDTALGIDLEPARWRVRVMTARKSAASSSHAGRDLTSEVAFLTRALKAPTLRDAVPRLAERARTESWTHEEFLVACLQREVSARESHGGEGRIRAARFPATKSLEEFDFDHARGLKRDLIAHLGTLDFVVAKENVVFLGPPGTGKTHLATGHRDPRLPSRPPRPVRHRVANGSPGSLRPTTPAASKTSSSGSGRYPLLVIDEVGYIPFEPEAANLFFQLVSVSLRTRQPDRHLQQALRPLGRGLRRRRRRRRHDRPARPPRRSRRPQRRLLPAQEPRPRPSPGVVNRGNLNTGGSIFNRRKGVSFRPALTRS